tara:strand:+ start:11151 stop:11432 length:282 start_codon:yes stop_codon:yes gene_type:complete
MAFSRAGWGPLGGQSQKGSVPVMWSYTSTDAKTAIDASGYFNDVSDDVTVGDIIYSWASTGGTATASWHVVVSNASGVVDVGDGVTIAVTDSD